jgi:hypothetical protein
MVRVDRPLEEPSLDGETEESRTPSETRTNPLCIPGLSVASPIVHLQTPPVTIWGQRGRGGVG